MASREGAVGTFNQTVGVKIDMDEAVDILTPSDVPLQQLLPTRGTAQVKVEWMEEDLMPQAVDGDGATAITGTGTSGDPYIVTLAADEAQDIRVGDILYKQGADSAVQWTVQAVNSSTDVVDLVNFAGNATAPTNADTFEIVGQFRDEGSDPEDARSVERTQAYNYTQIYQEAVKATRTARRRGARGGLYGQRDPYDHEVMKKFKELAIRCERSLIHGQRAWSSDAKRRSSGGLFYFLSTNTASGTAANAKTVLNSLLRQIYNQGGSCRVAVVSPAVKEALSNNIDPTLRRASYEARKGGFVVDTFMSDFGEIEFVTDRHMPTTKGIALQTEYAPIVNFDGFFHELLAKTGDGDEGHIVGEKSLEVKNEAAHGVFTITDAS